MTAYYELDEHEHDLWAQIAALYNGNDEDFYNIQ